MSKKEKNYYKSPWIIENADSGFANQKLITHMRATSNTILSMQWLIEAWVKGDIGDREFAYDISSDSHAASRMVFGLESILLKPHDKWDKRSQ